MRKPILAFASALIFAVTPAAALAYSGPAQDAAAQPKPKSQKEVDSLKKVQAAAQANDPKAELQAIKDTLENFADTEYKPMLLGMAVQAAEQSGDYAETVVWGERAIENNPNDASSRVILAESTARNTHQNDLDKDQSLKKINDYANKALDLLKTATPASAGVPDAQWPQYKQNLTDRAYIALGDAAFLNKNFPDEVKEIQAAVAADPSSPLPTARLSKAYVDNKQYDEAIATADKVIAMADAPQQIKDYAQGQKSVATKLKAAGAK